MSIDVYWLNKHGYFVSSKTGGIEWVRDAGFSTTKNSITISTFMDGEDSYLRIMYYDRDLSNGKRIEHDYTVRLTTTPCNYGGVRWWFSCPLITNRVPCGRRVGTLYKYDELFGCRHCYNLTYNSRNLNSHGPEYDAIRAIKAAKAADKLKHEMKRHTYAGVPTKKQNRYYKLYEQSSGKYVIINGRIML